MVSLRRLKLSLGIISSIAGLLLLAIYLFLFFIFRFYLPLKLRRWWNVRRFKRMLMVEGLPEHVASKIAEAQYPEIPSFSGFWRLIGLGQRKK